MLKIAKLTNPQFIPATAGSIYTNPAGTKTRVREIRVHNTGTTTETVKLYLVYSNAGALGTAEAVNNLEEISLVAKESVHIPCSSPIPLDETNDAVFAETTTANRVNILLLGGKDDGL